MSASTKMAFVSTKPRVERRRARKARKDRNKQGNGGLSDRGYLILCRALCIVHKRSSTMIFGKLQKAFTTWAFHARFDTNKEGTPLNSAQRGHLQLYRTKVLSASEEHGIVTNAFNVQEAKYATEVRNIKQKYGLKYILLFWNLRYLNSLRKGFDIWHVYSKTHERISHAKKLHAEINQEFEKINSKTEYIKGIEETNSRLQLSLLVKLAVLRLRAHSTITAMSATRERNRDMRQIIFDEVMKVKESLSEYNEMERKLLISASAHRDDYFSRLERTRIRVEAALEAQFNLKKGFDENLLRQFQEEEEEESKAMEATGTTNVP